MKEYISKKICEVLGMEIEVKVEIPPKDDMGDFSVQCASLRNEQYKNPMEIASLIIEKFNDSDKNFKEIKQLGPYVNFYLDYNTFASNVIKDIESNEKYGSLNQGANEELLIEHTSINPNAEPHIGRCRNSL